MLTSKRKVINKGAVEVVPTSRDGKPVSAGKQAAPPPKLAKLSWKPTVIPPGFGMTIDTREQKHKHLFRGDQPFPVKRCKLETGDYAITNYESFACVELKRLSDFDSFMGAERDTKTVQKLERMRTMLWAALVIQCAEAKVFGVRRHGKMTREHARGFLKMVEVQYGIHTYISPSREKCERWILDRLAYVYRGLV